MNSIALPTRRVARQPLVPDAILGTLVFVAAETMFFVGMISAFTISRSQALPGTWPMPGQPTLPVASTAFNTAALLLSGVLVLVAQRLFSRGNLWARRVLAVAWALGAVFVILQGAEWAALLKQGLTMTSSRLGAFFYLLVGTHALHAVGALIALGWTWLQMSKGRLSQGLFFGSQVFWYFVVLMWPVLYLRVYF
ncbi:MAG: cytochrome c oxidase subunit 3 [Myxococcaceae bacterium]|nr:cytochrome c oxidase subunit 3 [Myxococcaceae bacterium]